MKKTNDTSYYRNFLRGEIQSINKELRAASEKKKRSELIKKRAVLTEKLERVKNGN